MTAAQKFGLALLVVMLTAAAAGKCEWARPQPQTATTVNSSR